MWLLSTDRAELHYYVSPEEVPDGYAILSHVWDKKEHTFQEINALRTRCEGTDASPRDLLDPSDKIRRCCEVAAAHGYRWVWIHTRQVSGSFRKEMLVWITCEDHPRSKMLCTCDTRLLLQGTGTGLEAHALSVSGICFPS